MDSFHHFRSQLHKSFIFFVVVTSPTKLDSSYFVNFVDLFEQNDQLSNDVIDAWSGSSQTYNVSSDVSCVEILSGSRSCFHEFLLSFDALTCSEHAVLDDKLSRFY